MLDKKLEHKPMLRWAGSKKQSIDNLKQTFPQSFDRYIELFAGSACLFFATESNDYLINDANFELIQFYDWMTKQPEKMHQSLLEIPRTKESYYAKRTIYNSMPSCFEKSCLFWFLNRNCFNGIYRENLKGGFNVPFANNKVGGYPSLSQTIAAARKLSNSELKCGDFEEIAKKNVRGGDFVYLDPPFYIPNTRVFKEYNKAIFQEADFERLSKLLDYIDSVNAKFLLSYPETELVNNLKEKWSHKSISVRRTISAKTDARKRGSELLFWN